MQLNEFIGAHWRYYLILEEKFIELTKYIEPVEKNFDTYSLELVHQLQMIGSEIDVVMKVICESEPNVSLRNRPNIQDYYPIILQKFPDIKSLSVDFYNLSYKPFEDWNEQCPSQSLTWWQAYNGVKHNRVVEFEKGNFKMVMYALSALCMLEMLYIKEISNIVDRPQKESDIFYFPQIKFKSFSMEDCMGVMQ